MIQIDMEMPAKCSECRMQTDYDFCSAMPKNFCGNTEDDGKPDWCPLKEVPDTNAGKWISVKDDLPKEHPSMFAAFYDTDKWNRAMWRTESDRVLVTIRFPDGTCTVDKGKLQDGEWRTGVSPALRQEVTHWAVWPEPPKEG